MKIIQLVNSYDFDNVAVFVALAFLVVGIVVTL
jgi:hypothetical protein